jgi:hypothetical protein
MRIRERLAGWLENLLGILLGLSLLAVFFGGFIAAYGPPDDPATRIAVWVAGAGLIIALPLLAWDEWFHR